MRRGEDSKLHMTEGNVMNEERIATVMALADRLAESLPSITDGSDHRVQCCVLGADLREAVAALRALVAPAGEPNDLSRLVHEALGEASMMWEPLPAGVFRSSAACDVAARLIANIRAVYAHPAHAPVAQAVPDEARGCVACVTCGQPFDEPAQAVPLTDAQQTEWQPIATAPHDGTDVLLFTPSDHTVAYSYGKGWHPTGVKASDEGVDVVLFEEPTMWMPVPPQQPEQAASPQADAERFFTPEFEVWQGDTMCASASGPREKALQEAMAYAGQYMQDGPVRVFEVTRKLVFASTGAPKPEQPHTDGGRNDHYEGLFDGETPKEAATRRALAALKGDATS